MYIIVVGAGAIGTQLIGMATASNNEVVVVERHEGRANQAAEAFDCLVLEADASNKDTLEEAGADRADAIISTTDEDAVNIMVMLLAKELGVDSRVSVVHNPEHMSLFRQIGVNVIENPQRLIAEYLLQAVQRPRVTDFMHLAGDAEIFEITVTEEGAVAGMTLSEAAAESFVGDDVLVVAIERGDETVTPSGKTEIRAGELVTVFSERGIHPEVIHAFTGEEG
jgi:trk system potassium uptake protein TrkA